METIIISLAGSFLLMAAECVDVIVNSGLSGGSARGWCVLTPQFVRFGSSRAFVWMPTSSRKVSSIQLGTAG